MTELLEPGVIGAPLRRIEGPAKVTGLVPYAFEQPVTDPLYLYPVQSTIARGTVTGIDTVEAGRVEGVVAVLTPDNAARLASDEDRELWILQSSEVGFRGQFVAAVIAETLEIARHAASLVRVTYREDEHDTLLTPERDDLYRPEVVNPTYPTDTEQGDVDAALAAASVVLDETYTTPLQFHNPMEPHTSVASFGAGELTIYDSTQSVHSVRTTMANLLGLAPERVHVISPHVGGGFGSKGMPHAHNVLVALAAMLVQPRPVKFALTRQQMFTVAGYRTPTIQRLRLGADADGRLGVTVHEVIEQTSRIKEFAEQTAVPTRMMYAGANRRTSHRLAPLDVPVPTWMRAPGECPGMFGLESAMDEMAIACGLDPIEFRVRNDTSVDPESGLPFSSRGLVDCLREGAARFGWERRDPTPGVRRDNGWLIGTGVASSTFPTLRLMGSRAWIEFAPSGRYRVHIGAADIGTGTWTTLSQVAADALEVPFEAIELEIGATAFPEASVAGGSSGMTSWGSAIVEAARNFRDKYGPRPDAGSGAEGATPENPDSGRYSMHAFGAQFAEVRVRVDTGEVRVSRMLGVFAAGRIINPRTARSQLIGGMTMGLSMALHEHGVMDPRFGCVVNHDFASYHIPSHADVVDIDAMWIPEEDPYTNPMGSKGIGEIGIVGAAAAVVNAVYHATGIRIRELPVTPDKLLR